MSATSAKRQVRSARSIEFYFFRQRRIHLWWILFTFYLLLAPAGRSEEVAVLTSAIVEYTYQGQKFRDPFTPLLGTEGARSGLAEKAEFNPMNVRLTGILSTYKDKVAVLADASGTSYFVREGRVLDISGNHVDGVLGQVKEKSVILIVDGKEVREVKLPSEEEKQ